jgi:Tfp pilus assembly protein PilW
MMRASKEAGFTLIEFSIASLTAMVMLAATFTLMNSLFTTNERTADVTATQQNVRVAINTIARDITMAGTGLPSGSIAVPNGLNSAAIIRPGMASFSSPDRNIETPNNTMPMISPGNNDGPTVNLDTDAMTILTLDQESPLWSVASVAIFSDRYEVTFTQPVNAGAMQLVAGDLLIFNNANGTILGCVTGIHNVLNTTALFEETDLMGVNQPDAATGQLGSLSNTDPPSPDYPPTTATRVNLINYFISTANAAHPRLMRAVNAAPAQIIAEDIEDLQFSFDLFDFETNTDTANQATTASPNQIRAVLVGVTGRSAEVMRRTNSYYRFPLVTKVNVRNSTFRNRYVGS